MPTLHPRWTEHFAAGVAQRIGGCSIEGRPGIARALAAAVLSGGRVLVLMSRRAGPDVIDHLRATARVSLVVTHPQTLRTLHLKGQDAEVGPAGSGDRALLRLRQEAVGAQLLPYGFAAAMIDTWYAVRDEDLVRVVFTISGAWDQTPGPGAGQAVELLP